VGQNNVNLVFVPLKVAVQGGKGIAGWLPNDNQQTTIAGSKSRRMNSIKSIKVNGSTALDVMHKRSGFGWALSSDHLCNAIFFDMFMLWKPLHYILWAARK